MQVMKNFKTQVTFYFFEPKAQLGLGSTELTSLARH